MYKNIFESYSISEVAAIEIAFQNHQIEYYILNQFGVGGTDGTMIQVDENHFEKANKLLIELNIRNEDDSKKEIFRFVLFVEKITNRISFLKSIPIWIRISIGFFIIFSILFFILLFKDSLLYIF